MSLNSPRRRGPSHRWAARRAYDLPFARGARLSAQTLTWRATAARRPLPQGDRKGRRAGRRSAFLKNCFRKIATSAGVKIAMTGPIDIAPATRAANAVGDPRVLTVRRGGARHSPDAGNSEKWAWGVSGKPRIFFDSPWSGFGWICQDLAQFGIGLEKPWRFPGRQASRAPLTKRAAAC
jgi:hypothetical protein